MKKLVLSISLAAAAALTGTAAFADAECQAGSAWGAKPGCGPDAEVLQQQPPNYNPSGGPDVARQYGWGYPYAYGNVLPGALGAIVAPQAAQRIFVDPSTGRAYQRPYAISQNDRDGDGIVNWRDRYPDDPRYR